MKKMQRTGRGSSNKGRTLDKPEDHQGSPVNLKKKSTVNIHWKTDAGAEAPILLPPDMKSQLIEKDPDAGKE